jgi:RNA polymerase sigma-70 factor (sigma-E family)
VIGVVPDDEFREFVSARSRDLLRFAWMLTYDAGRAEDLLQTSLAKAWPHWSRIVRDGDPATYVRKVMVNTATAWWSRRWRGEVPTGSLPEVPAAGQFEVVDDRDALLRALRALAPRQRAVVVLRYFEGRSEAETAAILGCSVGTVKSHASRALATLRATDAVENALRENR